jgi:hypothetical protein
MAYDVSKRPEERRRYLGRSLLLAAVAVSIAVLPLIAFPGGEVQLIGSAIPFALMTTLYRAANGKSERRFRGIQGATADEAGSR